MSLRTLLTAAFVTSALALAVASWMALSEGGDPAAHRAYEEALSQALAVDATLNEGVAESTLGYVTHYDHLVRLADRIAGIQATLERPPAYVRGERRQRLDEALARYGEVLDEKLSLLEHFKTEQAVLRNARRALPFAIERLGDRLRQTPDAPVARRVPPLLEPLLLQSLAPGPTRQEAAGCALEHLAGVSSPGCGDPPAPTVVAPEVQVMLDAVLLHGRVVLERGVRVDELVRQIITAPITAPLETARHEVREAWRVSVERRTAQRRAVEVFGALTLVFGAALLVARFRADAIALRQLTGKLSQAMAELRVERDREKELAQLKSRFLSMTSHEFRTPLSVIVSSAELLSAYGDRAEPAWRDKHHARILGAGEAMASMIERVLLIGRADVEMLDFNPRPVALRPLIDDITSDSRGAVDADHRLELEVELPEAPLNLDPELLRHALGNLLVNAFKFSPASTAVRLRVRAEPGGVRFEVADEGIGIPAADLPALFEPFHRCDNAADIPGTGLGLAIVKRSVERHQGSLTVDSAPGRGTRFSFFFPDLGGPA